VAHLSSSVLHARQRASYYRDANGISDFVIGSALLVFGSRDYLAAKFAPWGKLGQAALVLGLTVLYGFMIVGSRSIAEWIMARLIYPRTGYVATDEDTEESWTRPKTPFWVFLALALMVVSVVLGAFFPAYVRLFWPIAIFLLFFSYVFFSGRYRLDPSRSLLFLIPLIGGLAWWEFSRPNPPLDSLLLVVGGSFVFAGLIRLCIYLLRNPRPAQPQS
jgi:hypothetical protein